MPLTNIENGFVTYSPFGLPPYKSGTVVNLICNLGFAPVGSTTTKCENGNWGHLGLCQPSVAQQCPPIPEITNGQVGVVHRNEVNCATPRSLTLPAVMGRLDMVRLPS